MTQNWSEIRKVGEPQSWFLTYQCWSQTNLDKDHKWPNKHHLAFDLSNMSFELLTIALLKYDSLKFRAEIGIGKIIFEKPQENRVVSGYPASPLVLKIRSLRKGIPS